jgi:hypothetical protein
MLRRLLVGSAQYLLGPFGDDSDLRRHGEKLVARGGQERQETHRGGGGPPALGAVAPPPGDRRGVRSAAQRRVTAKGAVAGSVIPKKLR